MFAHASDVFLNCGYLGILLTCKHYTAHRTKQNRHHSQENMFYYAEKIMCHILDVTGWIWLTSEIIDNYKYLKLNRICVTFNEITYSFTFYHSKVTKNADPHLTFNHRYMMHHSLSILSVSYIPKGKTAFILRRNLPTCTFTLNNSSIYIYRKQCAYLMSDCIYYNLVFGTK